MTLRLPCSEAVYKQFLANQPKGCPFCRKELFIKRCGDWLLLGNRFPYDAIAETHHLLVPYRHVPDYSELTEKEIKDLKDFLSEIQGDYTFKLENFPKYRTIKPHYHLHLIKLK